MDVARRDSAAGVGGATISVVTTREKFETLLDRLSEDQLKAEYERLQRAVAGEGDESSSPRPDLRGSVKLLVSPEEFVKPIDVAWDAEAERPAP
jgi:hypothetical protein